MTDAVRTTQKSRLFSHTVQLHRLALAAVILTGWVTQLGARIAVIAGVRSDVQIYRHKLWHADEYGTLQLGRVRLPDLLPDLLVGCASTPSNQLPQVLHARDSTAVQALRLTAIAPNPAEALEGLRLRLGMSSL